MVDFGRLNHIKHVVECDYDVRRDVEVGSQATCVYRYLGTMKAILDMPVAAWNDPGVVAGEIDTDRKKDTKMAYGHQEDVYGRLDRTKAVNQRDPFIGEGPHELAVLSIEKFMHKEHGPSARATLLVLKSNVHQVGSRVCKLWNLVKPSKFESQTTDADLFADFVRKLKGAPDGTMVGAQCRALLEDRVPEQLARGIRMVAFGVNTSKKADKPYVNVNWTNIPQSQEEIAAMRARIDADPALAYTYSPPRDQNQGYQQPQQYAPQQMQVQEMQYQQRSQYGAPPPQTPNQWGAPQAPAQQYAPPAQPVQAPATGVPQGGFLAQIPPAGPPTGNGNGGW